ncbi:unnamed protein product, partial [Symbiodinium sp. CCMP2592]
AEWEALDTDIRKSRLENLKAKMQALVIQNQADLKELNKVQSSPARRGRSSKSLRPESSSDNEEERSERLCEAEPSPEPGAGTKPVSEGKVKRRKKEAPLLALEDNKDLFAGRFAPRKDRSDKKSSPPARVSAEKESKTKTDDVLPWLLLDDVEIKRFFTSHADLMTLSDLIRNEDFADSLSEFLTSAFADDSESPSWCKAELGEEALSIFNRFSFKAKKNFDRFCAAMKSDKATLLSAAAFTADDDEKEVEESPMKPKQLFGTLESIERLNYTMGSIVETSSVLPFTYYLISFHTHQEHV